MAVARAGAAADPPAAAPEGLRRVLKFRTLQTAALETVRRVLDTDEDFRRRVVEAADEAELGRAAWLWLAQPDRWAEELAALASRPAVGEASDGNGGGDGRELARLRRALAGAEEAARRHAAAAETEAAARRRARTELTQARASRRDAVGAADAARREAEVAIEERDAAVKRLLSTMAELGRVKRQLDVARSALHEAEVELATERAGGDPASDGASAPARLQTGPVDGPAVADRLRAAAATAAGLADALAAVTSELPSPCAAEQEPGAAGRARRPRRGSAGTNATRARKAAPGPPGIRDDAPEVAAHLFRLPGAVVLVDGYNVARTAWSGLDPEEERRRLIAVLEELHARTGAEVIVVFDGVQHGPPMSGQVSRTVRVRFTADGIPADDDVRDLVDEFPVERPVVVVSSDREVVDGARAKGANAISSRQLLTAIGR